MTDNNTPYGSRDEVLAAVYSEPPANTEHLVGMTTRVLNSSNAVSSGAAAAQSAPADAGNGPDLDLSEARSPIGQRITDAAQLTSDSIVRFAGVETSIATLVTLGLVVRDGVTGTFRAVEPQQATSQPAPAEPAARMDDHSEAIVAEATEKAAGETMAAAVEIMSSDGRVSDGTVARIASRLSIEPEQARARIAHVQEAYARAAVAAGAKAAETSEEVAHDALQSARTARTSELRQAAEQHFTSGAPAGYKDFVIDFVAGLGTSDPDRILTATPVPGRTVRWDAQSRQVLVKMADGSETTWAAAVRSGLIMLK